MTTTTRRVRIAEMRACPPPAFRAVAGALTWGMLRQTVATTLRKKGRRAKKQVKSAVCVKASRACGHVLGPGADMPVQGRAMRMTRSRWTRRRTRRTLKGPTGRQVHHVTTSASRDAVLTRITCACTGRRKKRLKAKKRLRAMGRKFGHAEVCRSSMVVCCCCAMAKGAIADDACEEEEQVWVAGGNMGRKSRASRCASQPRLSLLPSTAHKSSVLYALASSLPIAVLMCRRLPPALGHVRN